MWWLNLSSSRKWLEFQTNDYGRRSCYSVIKRKQRSTIAFIWDISVLSIRCAGEIIDEKEVLSPPDFRDRTYYITTILFLRLQIRLHSGAGIKHKIRGCCHPKKVFQIFGGKGQTLTWIPCNNPWKALCQFQYGLNFMVSLDEIRSIWAISASNFYYKQDTWPIIARNRNV